MRLHLATTDGVPIYLQIANQFRYAVSAGQLAPGEQLPPVRQLAKQLSVNPNTVARAYRELEAAGILVTRRGSGVFISGAGSPLARREQNKILTERVDSLLAVAKQLDFDLESVLNLVRQRNRLFAS